MKVRSCLWRGALAEKLIKLRISPERERNIRYTDEKLEFNQIPTKRPSNKEIKCVDACIIEENIEQTMLNLQPII